MGFTLSQIIKPQFVAITTPTALVLVTKANGTTGTTVPTGTQLTLSRCRIKNVTANPVTLKLFWVAAGGTAVDQYQEVNITIPPPTFTQPFFEWSPGIQLAPGDAIFGLAGTVSALTISGSGGIST